MATKTKTTKQPVIVTTEHRGVALWGEVQTEGDKMGALKREILAEVP